MHDGVADMHALACLPSSSDQVFQVHGTWHQDKAPLHTGSAKGGPRSAWPVQQPGSRRMTWARTATGITYWTGPTGMHAVVQQMSVIRAQGAEAKRRPVPLSVQSAA